MSFTCSAVLGLLLDLGSKGCSVASGLRAVIWSYAVIIRRAVRYFSHCFRFHHGDMTSIGGDGCETQTRLLIHGAPLYYYSRAFVYGERVCMILFGRRMLTESIHGSYVTVTAASSGLLCSHSGARPH
jgi:hypothetical protein